MTPFLATTEATVAMEKPEHNGVLEARAENEQTQVSEIV